MNHHCPHVANCYLYVANYSFQALFWAKQCEIQDLFTQFILLKQQNAVNTDGSKCQIRKQT